MVVAADLVDIRSGELDGWELREAGAPDADATALLLPGGMCSTAFYDDVLGYAALEDVRLVAATPPGSSGTRGPLRRGVRGTRRRIARPVIGIADASHRRLSKL